MKSRFHVRPRGLALILSALLVAATACATSPAESRPEQDGDSVRPRHGGSLVVLENSRDAGAWPEGLDPATNSYGPADQSYMNAIFGQLFKLGEGAKIIPSLATGFDRLPDGKTVEISLRKGVTFQDGTTFDAEAVVWNIERVMNGDCTCKPTWPLESVTLLDEYTVELRFSKVFAPVIPSFFASPVNWIASPTAVKKMGEKQFALKPVGAGPFQVVSNKLSEELVLERFPDYWQEGRPYLDKLTFRSIRGDKLALEEMRAGRAHVYEEMTTPALMDEFQSDFVVTEQLSTSAIGVQLNTLSAPFDNPMARKAIYYATNVPAINEGLFDGQFPTTESFTGPGGICYQPDVPGYRDYDLEKAKALVEKLGGLKVRLSTIDVAVGTETMKELQRQWTAAGMDVKIHTFDLEGLFAEFSSGTWQATVQTVGSYDPAAGVNVGLRFRSNSPFSGVRDPKLDAMLDEAAETLDEETRCGIYNKAAEYINEQAYGPFIYGFTPSNIMVDGVYGPGLTTPLPSIVVTSMVLWEDVYWAEGS